MNIEDEFASALDFMLPALIKLKEKYYGKENADIDAAIQSVIYSQATLAYLLAAKKEANSTGIDLSESADVLDCHGELYKN